MILELTDREVELLIDALRHNEKVSRRGFATWLIKAAGNSTTATTIDDKTNRAKEVWEALASLRARLGDRRPIRLEVR